MTPKFGVYSSGYVVMSFIKLGTIKRRVDSMGNNKKNEIEN